MNNNIKIFDRELLKQRRNRAAKTIDQHDFLIRKAGEILLERLEDMQRSFDNALDLGCRKGYLAASFTLQSKVKALVQGDLSEKMLEAVEGVSAVLDEEQLEFPPASFDLVLSVLNFHWVNDLPGALIQIKQALKPNGLLLANMFGTTTLQELRQVINEVEMQEKGGVSPRVPPFVDIKTMGGLLQRAGLDIPVTDSEIIPVSYPNVFELLADIKGMGESNVMYKRGTPLTKGTLAKVDILYKEKFSDGDGGIKATFEIITMTGLARTKETG